MCLIFVNMRLLDQRKNVELYTGFIVFEDFVMILSIPGLAGEPEIKCNSLKMKNLYISMISAYYT